MEKTWQEEDKREGLAAKFALLNAIAEGKKVVNTSTWSSRKKDAESKSRLLEALKYEMDMRNQAMMKEIKKRREVEQMLAVEKDSNKLTLLMQVEKRRETEKMLNEEQCKRIEMETKLQEEKQTNKHKQR